MNEAETRAELIDLKLKESGWGVEDGGGASWRSRWWIAMTDNKLAIFENYKIRRHYDEQTEIWYFSVVDILQSRRDYLGRLPRQFKAGGTFSHLGELVTVVHLLNKVVPR